MAFNASSDANFDVKRLKSSYGKVKITEEIKVNMTILWKGSTQAFVKAVAARMLTMDTGMSKASLIPLARQVKALTAITKKFGKHVKSRKGAFDIHGIYHKDWERNTALGEQLGATAFQYHVPASKKRMIFHFSFEIAVWQYLKHEKGYKSMEAWQTTVAGRTAFTEYYNANFDSRVKQKISRLKFHELFL